MSIIGSAAACCAQATLAADQQTTQETLAAQKEISQPSPAPKFDWEQNAANLRRLKQENSSLNRDECS
jgi:hypothetical protein